MQCPMYFISYFYLLKPIIFNYSYWNKHFIHIYWNRNTNLQISTVYWMICLCLPISGSQTSSVTRLASTRSAQMAKLGCRATNLPPWQMAVGYEFSKLMNMWLNCPSNFLLGVHFRFSIWFYLVGGCCGYFRLHDFHIRTVLATSVICFSCRPKKMRLTLRILQDQPYHFVAKWPKLPQSAPVPRACRKFRRPHMATPRSQIPSDTKAAKVWK